MYFLKDNVMVIIYTQAFIHDHRWYMESCTGILSYLFSGWNGLTLVPDASGDLAITPICLQLAIRLSNQCLSSDGKVMVHKNHNLS